MALKSAATISSVNVIQGVHQTTHITLADVVATARPGGLSEFEIWAVLCQAVQAMQDLFLSDGVCGGNFLPLITPQSILLTGRGRVILSLSRTKPVATHFGSYLAPEYQHGRKYQDQELEKMLVYSLAQTLRRCCVPQLQPHSKLHHLLLDATRLRSVERSTLMHLLEVISEYSRRREQLKPFSHTVMDLYKETIMYHDSRSVIFDKTILDSFYRYNEPNIIEPSNYYRKDFLPNNRLDTTLSIPYKSKSLKRAIYHASIEQISSNNDIIPKYVPGLAPRPRSIYTKEELFQTAPTKTLKNRKLQNAKRNPVKRAASRLYQADKKKIEKCIGPEFVVRAGLGSKKLILVDSKVENAKSLLVIMLNGVKLEIICKPEVTTAGQLLEKIVQHENIEENFFLGLSVLISGDFVFLPSDVKISKILPNDNLQTTFTLFVRVRFFLPSLRGIRNPQSRHLLYLQLRRSILKNQLPCSIGQLCELGGLALQAEFGDFSTKHEANHYFLIEHYIPETLIDMSDELRDKLTGSHIEKNGMDPEKAEENFMLLAQSLKYYGAHFYSAGWVFKNKNKNVWLCVTAQGLSIFDRDNSGIPSGTPYIFEDFKWQSIQTLCYSKHFLCILPQSSSLGKHKLKKYKLKMNNKKSYYSFRLASLHHQFFLRLRTEYNSLQTLSQQFGILLKDIKNETNSLFKMNSKRDGSQKNEDFVIHNSNIRQNKNSNFASKCRRSKSVIELCSDPNLPLEEFQNKENESPANTRTLPSARKGVIMGTKAFSSSQRFCRSLEAVNAWASEEKISSSSPSRLSTVSSSPQNDAYVINSSIKSCNDPFLPNLEETLSRTLEEKLKNVSFTDERILKAVTVYKDSSGSLGIQVMEGSDGKAYIQSVVPFSPASLTGNIFKGDQIIAVNSLSLINLKYLDVLDTLKSTGVKVELILSQIGATFAHNTGSNFGTLSSKILKSPNKNSMVTCDLCSGNLNCSKSHNDIFENRFSGSKCNLYNSPIKGSFDVKVQDSRPLQSLNFEPLYKDSRTNSTSTLLPERCISLNNFSECDINNQCNISIPNIALPRSLGLGRRWRGPVRYPVTPIKHQINPNESSYIISDDEQIFI